MRAVVSDRKLGVSLNNSTVEHYNEVIVHVLWQKLGSDTNMEWADMINTKVKTDIHGVIERPDGTYAAIGNY